MERIVDIDFQDITDDNDVSRISTAAVKLQNENDEIKEVIYYVISAEEIYIKIHNQQEIDLNGYYIEDFSIQKYRTKYSIPKEQFIEIKSFNVDNSIFAQTLDFSRVKIYNQFSMKESIFNRGISISTCLIGCEADFSNSSHFGKTQIQNSLFLEKTNFYKSYFTFVSLSFASFNKTLSFHTIYVKLAIHISECKFKEYTTFEVSKFENSFKLSKCEFRNVTFFDYCTFEHISSIETCHFYLTVSFNNTTFRETLMFLANLLEGQVYFFNATFNQEIMLNGSKALVGLNFSHSTVAGFFTWQGDPNYKEVGNIFCASFMYTSFKKNVTFENISFKTFILNGSEFEKELLVKNCLINYSNRETYRIIKHLMLRANNQLDAVEYFKLEMNEKKKEIKKENNYGIISGIRQGFNNILRKTKSNKVPQNLQLSKVLSMEFWLLTIYKSLNKYGTSFGRGLFSFVLVFASMVTLFVHCGIEESYFEWGYSNWNDFCEVSEITIQYVVEFLNPAHRTSDIEAINATFRSLDNENSKVILTSTGKIINGLSRIIVPIMVFFLLQPLKKYKSW